MATEYKIIKIRRSIESAFVPSNLLPGELHITTDTGKVHYCYSAGSVKQLATIEQLQGLLNVSPEAYIALQQLITELEDETVLSGILADINELKTEISQSLAIGEVAGTAFEGSRGKILETGLATVNDSLANQGLAYAEKKIGVFNDGTTVKDLYQKTRSIGALPNNAQQTYAHGITNLSRVFSVNGVAYSQASGIFIPLPFSAATLDANISVSVDSTNITIVTGRDRSSFNNNTITLVYTKN